VEESAFAPSQAPWTLRAVLGAVDVLSYTVEERPFRAASGA